MRDVTLYHDDCFTAFPNIKDGTVDLILCDPPYGTTAIKWDSALDFKKMWIEVKRILKPNGTVILFGSQPFSSMLICSNLEWFKYELIWNKNKCGSPGLAKIRPQKTHENIMVFSNGKTVYNPIIEAGDPYKRECKDTVNGYGSGKNTHGYGFGNNIFLKNENAGTRYPKSILHCSRNFSAQQTVHPTQKPTTLLSWLILTYSNEGDVVCDFTMGSGSTGVSAVETNRNFIGIEREKEYYDIASSRISSAVRGSTTMKTPLLITQNEFMDKAKNPQKKSVVQIEDTSENFFEET